MSFTEEIIEINEAIAANGVATVNVTYSDRNGSHEAIVYVHEVCPAGLDLVHAHETDDFIHFGFIESINVLDEAPAPEKAEEAKDEDEEAPNGYVVKRDSDKAVISEVFATYNEASNELSRIAREGIEEGWMYIWEAEAPTESKEAMTIQIRATITGYPNEEETFTEIIDATQTSEPCDGCGRKAEVLSFQQPMVEPETGPSNICLRCLNSYADYEVIGLSIRCDWDLSQPIQPANPEVGACESCEVDGLTIYRFRAADFKEPEGHREAAVCRQCFAGGFAPANGYSLVTGG